MSTFNKLFVILLLIPITVEAEIDFKLLKGSKEFLSLKEECSYLSSHIPLALIRQGKLNNEYIYGDKTDPVIKLIKMAFNSVSENPAFFQVSPLAENVAKFLPPSAIGKILGKLKMATTTTPLTAADLAKIVEEDENFKALVVKEDEIIKKKAEDRLKEYEETSEDSRERARLERELNESKQKYAKEKEEKMKELATKEEFFGATGEEGCTLEKKAKKEIHTRLEKSVKDILKKLALSNNQKEQELTKLNKELAEKRKKLRSEIHKAQYDRSNLVNFFDLFLFANSKVNMGSSEYIPHYAEQILLSIAWMNGSTKEDLLVLYQALPESCFYLDKSGIKDPLKQTTWLKEKYSEENYAILVSEVMKLNLTNRAEYFLDHPDDLTFISYGRPMLDSQALPTMGFKQVDFVHPVSKSTERMPDCMEMAILNKMLNDLAGGPGNTFDVTTLKENLKKMGYQMHPGLEEFLKKYPNPSLVNEIAAHKMWAELVSGLPGVKYNPIHPTFEIVPTVGNALAVYGALLFNSKLTPLPREFSDYETRDRAKKLDMICKALSRKDREIGWQLRGKDGRGVDDKELNDEKKNETNLVLEFAVNRQPKYDWVINSGHSQVNPKTSSNSDFRAGVGKEMAQLLLKDEGTRFKRGDSRLLPWLLTSVESNDKEIASALKATNAGVISPTHYSDFIGSIPLESVDNKLFVIGEFAEAGNTAKVDRLKSKIPNDLDPQRRFYATLADHYYYHKIKSPSLESKTDDPQYKDKKPLFNPITLAEDSPLIKVLGSKYVWEEGGLIWGDTIKNPDSSDKKMNFKDAVEYCLKLNKSPLPTTQAEFEKFTSDKTNKPPFDFCYLPTREEYKMLSRKMNGDPDKWQSDYLPQFLANLYGSWFWSSSVDDANDAHDFSGNSGGVGYGSRNDSVSVRCVCRVGWRGN